MTIPSSFPISLSLCKDRPTTAERGETSLPPYGGSSHLSSLCLVPPSLLSLSLSLSPAPVWKQRPPKEERRGGTRKERESPSPHFDFPAKKKGRTKSAFFPTLDLCFPSFFLSVPPQPCKTDSFLCRRCRRAEHSVKCLRCVRGE